jgi:hypothetical protein
VKEIVGIAQSGDFVSRRPSWKRIDPPVSLHHSLVWRIRSSNSVATNNVLQKSDAEFFAEPGLERIQRPNREIAREIVFARKVERSPSSVIPPNNFRLSYAPDTGSVGRFPSGSHV